MTVGFIEPRRLERGGMRGRGDSRDRLERLPGRRSAGALGRVACSVFSRSRSVAVGEHLGDLGQDLEVRWVAASGTSRKISRPTGSSSGASKAIGWRTPQHRGERVFRPLMRPCGMATPWPRPVEPRRSRANRLSVTVARGDRVLVLEQQPGLLERALLAGGVDAHQHLSGGQDGGETIHRSGERRFQR